MATTLPTTNGKHDGANGTDGVASFAVKAGLARMLKGGVIMDVVNAEQVCPILSFLPSLRPLTTDIRPVSLRRPVPAPLWHLSAFLPIFARTAVSPACLTPA